MKRSLVGERFRTLVLCTVKQEITYKGITSFLKINQQGSCAFALVTEVVAVGVYIAMAATRKRALP
jgi:hypothetical protein